MVKSSIRIKIMFVIGALLVLSQLLLAGLIYVLLSKSFVESAYETNNKTNELASLVTEQWLERNPDASFDSGIKGSGNNGTGGTDETEGANGLDRIAGLDEFNGPDRNKLLADFYESGANITYLTDSNGVILLAPDAKLIGKVYHSSIHPIKANAPLIKVQGKAAPVKEKTPAGAAPAGNAEPHYTGRTAFEKALYKARAFIIETAINAGAYIENETVPAVENFINRSAASVETFVNEAGYYAEAFIMPRELITSERSIGGGQYKVITTIQREIVLEGVIATTKRNILFSLSVLFLTLLFLWNFSLTITRPLAELRGAVEKIDGGFYNIEITNKNSDETRLLTDEVIAMKLSLINFERFTNKFIARLARTGTLPLGGASKETTIFFSDIRSFTAISETMDADEVVRFLNDYMERMVRCVINTGGAIDKFIGDAVFAHWGAVSSAGSAALDALAAVSCALMMRAALASFNKGRGSIRKPIIKIGMGINSGAVVAGQIGSADRLEFTIIGDDVALADRTETFNKPFGTDILITENTYKLCRKYLLTKEMPSIQVSDDKGNNKKLRMFAVINMKDEEQCAVIYNALESVKDTDLELGKKYVGPSGPRNISELRTLLQIPTPDLSSLNLDEEEKKYKTAKEPPAGASGSGGAEAALPAGALPQGNNGAGQGNAGAPQDSADRERQTEKTAP